MASTRNLIEKAEAELGELRFAGVCGVFAEGDPWYEENVPACTLQEMVEFRNVCPIYQCAKARGVPHCGVCPEFPCELLISFAAHDRPPRLRIESAAKRAELGDEAWMEWARGKKLWRGTLCPLQPKAA
jgi:hypothetical protein